MVNILLASVRWNCIDCLCTCVGLFGKFTGYKLIIKCWNRIYHVVYTNKFFFLMRYRESESKIERKKKERKRERERKEERKRREI